MYHISRNPICHFIRPNGCIVKLSSISVKDVRAQLLEDGVVNRQWLRDNKDAVKNLIQGKSEYN